MVGAYKGAIVYLLLELISKGVADCLFILNTVHDAPRNLGLYTGAGATFGFSATGLDRIHPCRRPGEVASWTSQTSRLAARDPEEVGYAAA